MNFCIVDDNEYALDSLKCDLQAIRPDDIIYSFTLPSVALEYLNNKCDTLDVALLDIEMPGMSGIELAIGIKRKFPRAVIIFVSAYPQYALDAFKIHADGYIMKPVSREALQNELDALAQPFVSSPTSRIRAQTFGNFELYVDGDPVKFARTRSKELIAYLIDRRGAPCSMNELATALLGEGGDEKSQRSYIRNCISDIRATLSPLRAEHIIRKEMNSIAIVTDAIDCDYYRMLDGEASAVNQYFGEYMVNYAWAEITAGGLNKVAGHQ